MGEAPGHHFVQSPLPGVAEGGVAQIMAQGNRFGQIFIEPQGPGDGPGNAGDLQRMGHPGAVVVPLRL